MGACRFFASLAPCETEEQVSAFIEGIKKELTGATHHATAYRLGFGEEMLLRCDDDGEPAGTAGAPMLSVLEKFQLTNIVVVGTRYFGGIKLGIGGLVRAYRSCAEAGIRAADICCKELQEKRFMFIPYDYLGAAIREVEAGEGKIQKFHYGQRVGMDILIPLRKMESVRNRIAAVTKGEADLLMDNPDE